MPSSKITTPEGFREAVEELSGSMGTLSAEQAAALADEIKGAAPKAARRFAADDLDDLRLAVEALRNRLRRKWKRQRSNNAWSAGVGVVCGAAAAVLGKFAVIPAAVVIALVVAGALFAILGVISVNNTSDWRDEVAKPIGDVVDTLVKQLDQIVETDDPYRTAPTEFTSTATRFAPADEPAPQEHELETPEEARRRQR